VLLAVAAFALPAAAPAGQSSQATSAVVAPLAAGVFHTCAVADNASVRCWGYSGDGQVGYGNRDIIGDDETPGSVGPVDVGTGRTVRTIAAGDFHTCALLDDGNVRCWGFGFEGQLGYANRNQIGDDELPSAAGPVNLGAGRTAVALSAGGRDTCAVLDDFNVRCWGLGDVGQLGLNNLNSIGDNETPGSVNTVDLGPGRTAKAVSAGGRHTCALLDNSTVRCWGNGGNGQLGYGDTNAVQDPSTVGPVDLGPGHTAKAISAGDAHTCAILDDGSVRCWGLGDAGQLGYGNTRQIGDNETPGSVGPVDLGPGRTATAISAGESRTCAVLDNGSVRCWGKNDVGQLGYGNKDTVGDNETPGSVAPVALGTGRTAVAVAAGQAHTCARLDDGDVRCWGKGTDGELGYCSRATIGDDETPATAGPVDLGVPGRPRAFCAPEPGPPADTTPTATPPAPTPTAGPTPTPSAVPPIPAVKPGPDPLAVQAKRAKALTACLRGPKRGAAARRRSCFRRFGRTPGRVTALRARAAGKNRIVLTFRAPGSDGAKPPAARRYQIRQALQPIRSARAFARATPLCKGTCSFGVTALRDAVTLTVTLTVTDLRRHRTYYYAVAARDNVSGRLGPRSVTVKAKTR